MSSPRSKLKKGDILSLEECEEKLRGLGLSEEEIAQLGDTIDVIGETLLDKLFSSYE